MANEISEILNFESMQLRELKHDCSKEAFKIQIAIKHLMKCWSYMQLINRIILATPLTKIVHNECMQGTNEGRYSVLCKHFDFEI